MGSLQLPHQSKARNIDDVHETDYTKRLLEQLTIEEKVRLLSGRDFNSTSPIPRLGIPALKLADSTSAVKSSIFGEPLSTACFPNTSALAATWNRPLLYEMGKAIAVQAMYKSAQVVLGPTINIHRDPRGGRNFESFSEDPVLTGHLAAALVNGIQSQGVGTCLKHFICNECETSRKKYSANIDERTLREIYLSPFQWVLREARPTAIMTAYNKLNNTYCDQLSLIKDLVRGEWGFSGLVMSDWFGTMSQKPSLEAGVDLEMPGPSVWRSTSLINSIKSGQTDQRLIDERVLEVLKLISRTSEVHSNAPEESGEDDVANALARQVAVESMVLLKNDNTVLPLDLSTAPKVALVGRLAMEYSGGGGSAGGVPHYIKTPDACIKDAHPQSDLVTISAGVPIHRIIPVISPKQTSASNGKPGVDVTYFNDGSDQAVLSESQPAAVVFMLGHVKPGLTETGFTYRMTTSLTPESTGDHTLAVTATGSFQLLVDGKEVMKHAEPEMTVESFLFKPWDLERRCSTSMHAHQSYSIELIVQSRRHLETGEPTPHSAKLGFLEQYSGKECIEEARQAASKADVSIIFAGRNEQWESEGSDLADLKLPMNQDDMIRTVAKASRKTIVVLYGGNPFDVSEWIEDVDAVVFAHYPGQEGATALTEILTGVVSPSGKLPMSWPTSLEAVPTFNTFPPAKDENGVKLDYKENLRVGYRHYWDPSSPQSSRWDFGYGLSYTSFRLSDLHLSHKSARQEGDNTIEIDVTVENTGSMAGAEILQVYVEAADPSVWRPKKELKHFEKVFLQPGEKQVLRLNMVAKYVLSYWDVLSGQWLAEKGKYVVHVGSLTASMELEKSFRWKGL